MEAAAEIVPGISLPLVQGSELLKAITIPLFTGAIGYVINWTGVWMLFLPGETLGDLNRYQVLESQPEAAEAMRDAGRTARTVRRSIHLTPFGTDFCRVCLPLDQPDEATEPDPEPETPPGE